MTTVEQATIQTVGELRTLLAEESRGWRFLIDSNPADPYILDGVFTVQIPPIAARRWQWEDFFTPWDKLHGQQTGYGNGMGVSIEKGNRELQRGINWYAGRIAWQAALAEVPGEELLTVWDPATGKTGVTAATTLGNNIYVEVPAEVRKGIVDLARRAQLDILGGPEFLREYLDLPPRPAR